MKRTTGRYNALPEPQHLTAVEGEALHSGSAMHQHRHEQRADRSDCEYLEAVRVSSRGPLVSGHRIRGQRGRTASERTDPNLW